MWKRHRSDRDFDDEIQAHIRLEADRLVEEGMDQEEALAAARRAFGNVTRSRERFCESRRWRWLERLVLDFRHAFRRLAREPRFTATALVTLAVCLGANLTIFAVVDSVLLRPLPFPEADRLVTLFNSYPKAGKDRDGASLTSYYERRGSIPAFARMGALMEATSVIGESGSTERLADTLVVRRSPALLAGLFAAVALLLAAIGTYGVLSFAVAQRRREIGVRIALGAEPRQIAHQFLLLGGRLLATGTMVGIVGAWMAGRAMQGILFDVPALHGPILGATAFVMGAVTLGACVLPSHRAARTSPFEAMNDD